MSVNTITAKGKHICFLCNNEIEWEFILDWKETGGAQTLHTTGYAIGKTDNSIVYEVVVQCLECYTNNKLKHIHSI